MALHRRIFSGRILEGPLRPDPALPWLELLRLNLRGLGYDAAFEQLSGRESRERIHFPGRRPTVLALHGYCGVPEEVRLVCEAATAVGLEAVAPVLPGHGTHPRDLARLTFDQVVLGVKAEFDRLRTHGPLIVVGLSMGSLIATELCLAAPGDVLGLGLLANAFRLSRPFPGSLLKCVERAKLPDFGVPKWDTDIADPEARRTQVSYRLQPAHFAISMQNAGTRLMDELFRVHCPTLIAHGAHDHACPVANAWEVAERLGTPDSRVVILPRSRHVICRDLDRVALKAQLETFFRCLL